MAIQQGPVATPLCSLWGRRARSVSTGQARPSLTAKQHKKSWKTDYKEKTHREAPKEFILEASGQPTGGGETGDHGHATSLGERGWGLFLKTAPAQDQRKPRAVLPEKHVN